MTEDDKNLAQELRDLAALSENGPYVSLKTSREAFRNAAARIESLSAEVERWALLESAAVNALTTAQAKALTYKQAAESAEASIESLSAELERLRKQCEQLQLELRKIKGTDQWRD